MRDALHGSEAEGCDFPDLVPKDETLLGGNRSAEAPSRRPSRRTQRYLEMTGEYTFVTAERQNELTRCAEEKPEAASKRNGKTERAKTHAGRT